MERANYDAFDDQQNMRHFTPVLLASQVLGITAIVLVAVWTGHYLGGFAWSDNVDKMFNYHPLFMVIGMIVIYGNATLVYRVFRRERKMTIKILHAFLQGTAFCLAVAALVAVFNNHNAKGFANLYSLHSWLGLATVVLFAVQFTIGFGSFLLPGISMELRRKLLPFHRYFGGAIFVGAVATALMGITENMLFKFKEEYTAHSNQGLLVNTLGLTLVCLAGCIIFLLVNPDYRRQSLPEEQMISLAPE